MQLIKFCKPEHNIHNGAKLRIGTLHDYRTIEDPSIQDESEGKYGFTIEFPEETELDNRWCNLLLQGVVGFGSTTDMPRFPGRLSATVERMNIVRALDSSVILKETVVRITRDMNNCLIFCMSLLNEVNTSPFAEYKDFWAFPAVKADIFGQRVGRLIFEQAKLADFSDELSKLHSPAAVQRLGLSVNHKKVAYRDRHLTVNPSNRPSFEELVNLLTDIPFIKPESFKHENEYRFMFELNDGERIFEPTVRNLLLTLNPLSDL